MVKLYVFPNYYAGHTYQWEVDPTFTDPGPWSFTVQQTDTGKENTDEWQDLHDTPVVDSFAFTDTWKVVHTRDFNIVYRVRLVTPNGTYYSAHTGPYVLLPRKEFLIAREIMRKEILVMREWEGVPVHIYKKTVIPIADRVTEYPAAAVDEITGQIIDPDLLYCTGGNDPNTGEPVSGAYHGPYEGFGKFSIRQSNKTIDDFATTDVQLFQVRMVAYPFLIRTDILVDMTNDKRYSIEKVESAFEVRRIPVIYNLTVAELPPSDAAYRLGSGCEPGEERCLP